jgi:opacity protein-like surface antigen
MKKITLSVFAVLVMSSFGVAGGDIVPVPVVAEENDSNFYIGVGLLANRTYSANSDWFDDGIQTQDKAWGLSGILGYNYNEYIGLEGRFTQTLWERDYSDLTTWSIFLKPQYRFWERDASEDGYDDGYFTVYGLLGFGNSNVVGTTGDKDFTSAWPEEIGNDILDETSFQWGIGLSYTLVDMDEGIRKNSWSLFIDYTMTANDANIHSRLYDYGNGTDNRVYDNLSTDGITVGVIYNF